MPEKIKILTIPAAEQRYDTVGDYWWPSVERLEVRVSELGNEDFNFLVAVHELIEAYLCKRRGISEPSITAFDIAFEVRREKGLESAEAEPGNSPTAPYRAEHRIATTIEYLVARELGVSWEEYDNAVNNSSGGPAAGESNES